MGKPPNMAAITTPEYAKLAIMPNGLVLQTRAFIRTTDIEEFVKHSPKYQTINRMLHGNPGNYVGVHRVFTAINAKVGGSLTRKDEVYIYNKQTQTRMRDPNLDNCFVFPKLGEYLARISATASRLGDDARVATFQVQYMIDGLPVSSNLVEAVFEAMNTKLGGKLERNAELFG